MDIQQKYAEEKYSVMEIADEYITPEMAKEVMRSSQEDVH